MEMLANMASGSQDHLVLARRKSDLNEAVETWSTRRPFVTSRAMEAKLARHFGRNDDWSEGLSFVGTGRLIHADCTVQRKRCAQVTIERIRGEHRPHLTALLPPKSHVDTREDEHPAGIANP